LKALAGPETSIDESLSAFEVKGGVSGGTMQTAISALEEVPRYKLALGHQDYALMTGMCATMNNVSDVNKFA
jgi:hypothetical protein